ncbi:MAG: Transducin (beta)-like 1 X-linked receptor 1 [Geoglossum umbratile]|nr:MAG: Transducin (beta)-like 1 X-linked receptor 1 [Geoglossum umbratile]
MTARTLSSDHVNYLVWRYLQEFGYGEVAVRLQRDWNLDPEALPFASHVRSHALVSLVQKGLLYHEIEQAIDQARHADPKRGAVIAEWANWDTSLQYGHPTVTTEASYFFGPDAAFSDKAPEYHVDQHAEPSAAARRRLRETTANGLAAAEDSGHPPAAKRSRKTNGLENGDAMELDQNGHGLVHGPAHAHGHGHAAAGSRRVSPALRATTNGASVAIQVDKVAELGRSETDFISPGSAVLSCVWNPVDPQALALKTDALCQIWAVARNQPPAPQPMDDDSLMSDITTTAWSPRGEYLATGAFDGQVSLWTVRGCLVRRMHPTGQGAVFRLKFNDDGQYLLGLTSDGDRLAVVVWSTRTGYTLNNVARKAPPRGLCYLAWINQSEFVVGGFHALDKYTATNDSPLPFAIGDDEVVVLAKSDGGGLLATSSESGYIKLWASTNRELLGMMLHPSPLICMEWQPLPHSSQAQGKPPVRILATGSEDGIVRLWNGRAIGGAPLHKFELGSSILALAFSPDGYFIAAASFGKLMIWNAEEGGLPRAWWTAKNAMDHRRGSANVIKQDPGPDHEDPAWIEASMNAAEWPDEQVADLSLSWDADGKKLAYGVGRHLAIIRLG